MDQMVEVQEQHPHLELLRDPSGALRVCGEVGFSIDHESHTIEDTYQIRLDIPDDFPDSPPIVYETEGKIPEEFAHFMEAGNFCLGAPVEVRRRFAQRQSLSVFIDDQVIPYLFAYSHKREYGTMPFGERSHGSAGLLEYYNELFDTSGIATMKLLKCLADDFAPPLTKCPCGGEAKLSNCHGPILGTLRPHSSPRSFERELRQFIRIARAAGIALPERKVMPKRMLKQRRRRRRRSERIKKRGQK